MTKSKLSLRQIIQVHGRLNQVIEKTEDGLCRYTVGDDATYAKELGVTVSNIQGVRTQMFGKLNERRTKPKEHSDIDQRLVDLALRVLATEKQLAALAGRLDRLISNLVDQSISSLNGLAPSSGPRAAHTNGTGPSV
jgi:hypothetical protein